jgi:hypothetical protein
MKRFVIITLLALSTPSIAGNYSHTITVRMLCHDAGERSSSAFVVRSEGMGNYEHSKVKLVDEVKNTDYTNQDKEILLRAINYGYDQAVSEENARMKGWAMCMDAAKGFLSPSQARLYKELDAEHDPGRVEIAKLSRPNMQQ